MRSKEEESLNALTHLIGCVSCTFVFFLAFIHEDIALKNKISFMPMVITSAWTFFSSYLYHSTDAPILKERNRKIDKSSIYLMILGSGVSVCLTAIGSFVGILSAILLCIIAGTFVCLYCLMKEFPEWLSLSSYIIIGWFATFPGLGVFSESLYTVTGNSHYILLAGLFYCMGIVFYSKDSVKWNHTIWHLFVLLGCATHIAGHFMSITQ